MSAAKNVKGQQYLPGMEPDPEPETFEQAERFLRRNCRTKIAEQDDNNLLSVTIKADDPDAQEGIFTQKYDVNPEDIEELRETKIDAAKKAFKWRKEWMEGEES